MVTASAARSRTPRLGDDIRVSTGCLPNCETGRYKRASYLSYIGLEVSDVSPVEIP